LIEREWEFLERAASVGVVKTLGLATQGPRPGLLTEYLPGGDFVPLAGSHPRNWAAAARELALALEGIHARGIVHRDVKPRNVLFDADGHTTLIDFALARRAGEASRAGGGTPAYQSLGHRREAPATPADDVHGFAAMIYELLAGELPFGRLPALETLETRPAAPLLQRPALTEEPGIAALAELVQAVLSGSSADAAQTLTGFQSSLHAIIAS